jgi:hypothetical protein
MSTSKLVKISAKDLKAKRASAALARVPPAAKRGPGRPRKNPLPEGALLPAKRGPGRPRKHPLPIPTPVVKRGPGRPRKDAQTVSAPKKRGRPPKAPTGLSRIEMKLAEIIVTIGLPRVEELLGRLKAALG